MMSVHKSYIVRVYRRKKDDERVLVGTVETIGREGKAAFTNLGELWEIMNGELPGDMDSRGALGPSGDAWE